MSKSETAAKESGAHGFKDKGHLKREKYEGAHSSGKHELPLKEQGMHDRGKPVAPKEGSGWHSQRPHPPVTVLSDSKILKGKKKV